MISILGLLRQPTAGLTRAMNPTLELIDEYENYNNPGGYAPIKTSEDANDINDYSGFNSNKHYRHFAAPEDIFEGKDARMWGTVIIPGTLWKNTKIVIQAVLLSQTVLLKYYQAILI